MKDGICKLCLQPKKLCESHIIPEFLYKELYDPAYKNRIRVLHTSPRGDDRPLQKGIKEYLLCHTCEGKFHEPKAKSLLFGRWPLIKREAGSYSGIPYQEFKVFQMSILWRASVAQARHWQYVKLSPIHAEKLRNMIFCGDPGDSWQYGCRIVALKHEGKVIPITSTPVPANGMGSECYAFVIAGMVWYFFVSDQPLKNHEKYFLQKDGTLVIQEQEFWDNHFIREGATRMRSKYGLKWKGI
jgi:hypothetical protein